MKTLVRVVSLSLVCILLIPGILAAAAGKIVGVVRDAKTHEPIIGVNILVVGTSRGASADIDGKYTIIGIPPGTYTIRATQVGYAPVEVKDFKVGADVTTPLDFAMSSSDVQLGEVVIHGEQLVNNMNTSSTIDVGSKSIESLPNVKSVDDVVKIQPGVLKQGNNIYVRGGRANEVQYVVDGVPVNNLLSNNNIVDPNATLSNLYAGMNSGTVGGGATGLSISANAISSVSVQTSGFDADYGNAQSGIINISTKSGDTGRYSGSAQFRTDRMAATNQNEAYNSFSLGGPEPLSRYLLPELGLKLPGSLTFFFNVDIDRSDGYRQYAHNQFYNPLQRKVGFNGLFGGIMNGVGFDFRDNQSNSFTFSSKLRYDISGTDQILYSYNGALSSGHDYDNNWVYMADSSMLSATLSINHNLSWEHFFGSNSYGKIILGEVEQRTGNDVAGILPSDYSPVNQNQDINNDGYYDVGTTQAWASSVTRDWSLRFEFNSQVHPLHLLKTGFEYHYFSVQSTTIDDPTVPHYDADGNVIQFPDTAYIYSKGLYPGFGKYRWSINDFPNRGALWVQDNIEFSGLNFHVGLRYDYQDIGRQVFDDQWISSWRTAVGSDIPGSPFQPDWAQKDASGNYERMNGGSTFWYYFTHGYFSPRLAIGYPVTDRIVFFFNYGHFLQFPSFDEYFNDPTVLGASGNYVGNPDLKPQKTIQYESGFDDQFADNLSFSLHAYYKDVFDYADLVSAGNAQLYYNFDYASTRGFDLSFQQALASNFSSTLSYSYAIAKGRASNPLASVYQPSYQLPRETRMDWDQNNTVNLFLRYAVDPRQDSYIFGIPLNNYGVSLTWSYGSGYPYSGYNGGHITLRNLYLHNSETAPYTSVFNLSLYKGFQVLGTLNMMATLDITNLFNRDNVSASFLQNSTVGQYYGRPAEYGDIQDPTAGNGIVLPWNRVAHDFTYPGVFEAPRQILLGIRMTWQ